MQSDKYKGTKFSHFYFVLLSRSETIHHWKEKAYNNKERGKLAYSSILSKVTVQSFRPLGSQLPQGTVCSTDRAAKHV